MSVRIRRGVRRFTLALALVTAFAASAHATETKRRALSAYEQESVQLALKRIGGTIEDAPEGKRIEAIEIVTFEMIEARDPAPQIVNWIHRVTRDPIIRREVLFSTGQPFNWRTSDETERNVRALGLFSVVIAVPVRGSTPDSVRYMILTKDVWSLRVGWNARFRFPTEGGGLPTPVVDYLSLRPMEFNLLGTGRTAFGTLVFSRTTTTVGLGYVEPRLGGTRLRVEASANAVLNCASGDLEGTSGRFVFSRPLYSTRTHWSFSSGASWSHGLAELSNVNAAAESTDGDAIKAGAICSANHTERYAEAVEGGRTALMPKRYEYDTQSFTQAFTRSFGVITKLDLGFGLEAVRVAYSPVPTGPIEAGPSMLEGPLNALERYNAERDYERRIASFRGYQRLSPYFSISNYTTHFQNAINVETLGLQEPYRTGPIASLKIYPALEAVGSSRDLLGISVGASYTHRLGTGYAKAGGYHSVELGALRDTDAGAGAYLRINSPSWLFGRLVFDTRINSRYFNYYRTSYVLGGTDRLRGYQSPVVAGPDSVVANLELRTEPLSIFSTMLGGVVFYDVGDAGQRFARLRAKQAAGFGVRFLAPQLDRDVFRIDLGFPIPRDAPGGEVTFVATFGQAFGSP
jgi:hypothetical protein